MEAIIQPLIFTIIPSLATSALLSFYQRYRPPTTLAMQKQNQQAIQLLVLILYLLYSGYNIWKGDGPNYYSTLEVDVDHGGSGVNSDLLKRNMRRMALLHHPDKNGDPAKFREIRTAFEVLREDNWRTKYYHFGQGLKAGSFKDAVRESIMGVLVYYCFYFGLGGVLYIAGMIRFAIYWRFIILLTSASIDLYLCSHTTLWIRSKTSFEKRMMARQALVSMGIVFNLVGDWFFQKDNRTVRSMILEIEKSTEDSQMKATLQLDTILGTLKDTDLKHKVEKLFVERTLDAEFKDLISTAQ